MFDDGWGEIGIGKSQKMSPEELDRTKKVHVEQFFYSRLLNPSNRYMESSDSHNYCISASSAISSPPPKSPPIIPPWMLCHPSRIRYFPLRTNLCPLYTLLKIRKRWRPNCGRSANSSPIFKHPL
jgi:hypothetical protein